MFETCRSILERWYDKAWRGNEWRCKERYDRALAELEEAEQRLRNNQTRSQDGL